MSRRAQTDSTLLAGFRVLGVAIRREPWVFTLSTLGSVLFGALTVADAWVLGWATDHVVLPAFEDGTTTAGGLIAILALFLGVAILRAVGIVARRLGAGIMQYRMQAHYRREVTRQYLTLPMAWHQRHPTGELLSNANSDVEAAWAPIAPLPMAVGTLAMMVIAIAQMLFTDIPMALVGLLVFPLVMVVNVVFQRLSSPIFTRIQALRAELSEIAHESFDGAMVVKTLGRESPRRPIGSPRRPTCCATRASTPAASGRPSTPSSRACPTSGCSPCSASASCGSSRARPTPVTW